MQPLAQQSRPSVAPDTPRPKPGIECPGRVIFRPLLRVESQTPQPEAREREPNLKCRSETESVLARANPSQTGNQAPAKRRRSPRSTLRPRVLEERIPTPPTNG